MTFSVMPRAGRQLPTLTVCGVATLATQTLRRACRGSSPRSRDRRSRVPVIGLARQTTGRWILQLILRPHSRSSTGAQSTQSRSGDVDTAARSKCRDVPAARCAGINESRPGAAREGRTGDARRAGEAAVMQQGRKGDLARPARCGSRRNGPWTAQPGTACLEHACRS